MYRHLQCIFIGTVSSIERNHEQVDLAKTGDEVCVKIENTTGEAPKLYGRHFNHEDALVSRVGLPDWLCAKQMLVKSGDSSALR